jgi:hypothetical protein
VGLAFSVPDGITLNAIDYAITGPTSKSGDVDLSKSLRSVEFAVGGLVAGSGYTITITGTDTNGDSCVSAATPFSINTLQTTQLDVTIVCTIGDGGYVLADAGTGSVQVDAAIVGFFNPTTTCPTIATYGADNVEFQTGTSTNVTVTTDPPGATVSFSMVATDDAGAGAGTVTPTATGATFTCTNPGQVMLTVGTTAPLANDAGLCPTQSQSLWINCEAPICGAGQTGCGATCVDTTSDPNNCGGCGAVCQAGSSCVQGACTSVCNPGLTFCGACINLASNASNCGACGNVCPSGQTCSGGTCVVPTCPPGQSMCNETCTPTDGDPNNCGGCGVVCPILDTCQQGVCQPPVAPGGDLVVVDDINPFDNTGMQNPNNPLLITNIVSFTTTAPRGSGTVVWMDYGRNSKCVGYCGDATIYSTMYSLIESAGLSITEISSTSGSLTSIDADVKLVFLWNPEVAYTLDEVNAFRKFASEGGRIVFLGEWGGYYGATGIDVENSFLVGMGAQMTNTGAEVDCGYTDLPASSLRPDQVTTGMTGVRMACASVITPGPEDFPLWYDSTNTQLLAGVAAIQTAPLTALPDPPPATLPPTTFNTQSPTGM